MVEREEIYAGKVKYDGVFSYGDFYKFCYDWLTEELILVLTEKQYEEKISGNEKEVKIKWEGVKELTDYFKIEIKVEFHITNMVNVEINKDGNKIKMNQGKVKITTKGNLLRDYKGKFETHAFYKFLRGIYEKWVITQRVLQFENYLSGKCDEFAGQAKAYLDLEGKR